MKVRPEKKPIEKSHKWDRSRDLSWLKGAAFIISARSYSINFSFASSHGAGSGHCGGAGSVRKGLAAAAHDAKREILCLLDETFIISELS